MATCSWLKFFCIQSVLYRYNRPLQWDEDKEAARLKKEQLAKAAANDDGTQKIRGDKDPVETPAIPEPENPHLAATLVGVKAAAAWRVTELDIHQLWILISEELLEIGESKQASKMISEAMDHARQFGDAIAFRKCAEMRARMDLGEGKAELALRGVQVGIGFIRFRGVKMMQGGFLGGKMLMQGVNGSEQSPSA